jgi:hypothetical protein
LGRGGGGLPGLIRPPPDGSLGGYRTNLRDRCPGAATDPAEDRSNPLTPEQAGGTCDAKDGIGR